MTARLSSIPVEADWSAGQDADEYNRNPPNCDHTGQSVAGDTKCIDWENATVECQD